MCGVKSRCGVPLDKCAATLPSPAPSHPHTARRQFCAPGANRRAGLAQGVAAVVKSLADRIRMGKLQIPSERGGRCSDPRPGRCSETASKWRKYRCARTLHSPGLVCRPGCRSFVGLSRFRIPPPAPIGFRSDCGRIPARLRGRRGDLTPSSPGRPGNRPTGLVLAARRARPTSCPNVAPLRQARLQRQHRSALAGARRRSERTSWRCERGDGWGWARWRAGTCGRPGVASPRGGTSGSGVPTPARGAIW